ncbi:restriction endonuclease subunit S [Aequorivita xiaoshiensis]|uniref:Restriction endonuclease subunit S n=1 Tax=Aequorivita xiaoshiensis TaxID=2874476 RepID=A0A9X1UDI8_9FLAO|nr:restriction endonuclease subunit S [Aequorivita xiaoshiensis]MCG2431626.1 restriction endonuclease subunit S [Aequorivita xiaoshiensis]
MMVQETYKTTWLAKAPEHWNRLRIKNIFAEIDERSETGQEELLSVSHYTGVTKKRDSLENETDFISNAKTLVGYKKVAENDLVSNIMLAWNGSLGISKYNGITSPAYCVYRIKGDNNPNYFGYLFSTAFMKAEFRKKSFGIIDSRLRLYSDKFFSIPAPVPPKAEQDQIVAYIKEQSKKIKHFIKKKQTFIGLLKEQKQSVIDKLLINKGKKVKIKYCVSKIGGGVTPKGGATVYKKSGILFLRSQNIYNDGLYLDNVAYITEEIHSSMKGSQVKKNDVLINVTGGSIGRCYTYFLDEEANVNQHVTIIRPILDILTPEFLMLQLQSDRIQHQIDMIEGASREGLTKGDISNYYLYLPPKEEQAQIVSHIKTETAKIDQAITKAQKEIELIKEYKEAMIAEAVLGKFNHKIVKS